MMTTKQNDPFVTMASTRDGKAPGSGTGGTTKSRKHVFMPPTSNPMKDSKQPQIRKMVARYAMKNRPKAALTPTPPPTDQRQSTTPPKSASPPVPIPTASSPSSSSSPSTTTSSPPPRVGQIRLYHNDSASAPFGFIARGTKEYYALDQPDFKSQKGRQRPEDTKSPNRMYKGSRPSIFIPPETHMYDDDNDDTVQSTSLSLIGDGLVDLDEDLGLDFHLISSSSESPETEYPLNPIDILSSSRNPFDCLPIAYTQHTRDLIDFYLTGSYLSPALTQNNKVMPDRVKNYRQNTWFPLAINSKILMHALMAYVETTPELPIPSHNSVYLWENVQEAYSGMRHKLENEKYQLDDSICMAVVLLMLTAQRTGDIATFRRHAVGLKILLKARATAFKKDKLLRHKSEKRWHGLDVIVGGPRDKNPCRYCQDSHLRPSMSRSPSPMREEYLGDDLPLFDQDGVEQIQNTVDPDIPISLRGAGFYDLVNRGYLAQRFSNFVEETLIMAELAEHTRHDPLSAAAASTHAWIDERPNSMPPLDTACQYSIRLCLYLSTWLEKGHGCAIVRRMAMAVYKSLRHPQVSIDNLMVEYPLVLLWLSLLAGPMTEEPEAEQWFSCLLVRARDATCQVQYMDFDQAIDTLGYLFVWINTLTPGARRFWMANSWDLGTAMASMKNLPS